MPPGADSALGGDAAVPSSDAMNEGFADPGSSTEGSLEQGSWGSTIVWGAITCGAAAKSGVVALAAAGKAVAVKIVAACKAAVLCVSALSAVARWAVGIL